MHTTNCTWELSVGLLILASPEIIIGLYILKALLAETRLDFGNRSLFRIRTIPSIFHYWVFGHYSVFFAEMQKNELEYRGLNVKGSTEAVYRSSHAHMYTSPFLVDTPHQADIINASLNNRKQGDATVSSL